MIYLDHAATSWPKPHRVIDAMTKCLAEGIGNPGRSGHKLSLRAERIVSDTRLKLARLFNAPDHQRVVFTLNGTDALNIAIKGVLRSGDHVVTTVLEHNSVNRPLKRLADEDKITVTRVPIGEDGCVDPAAVERAITSKTRLIVMLHASNVTGMIQLAVEIGRIAREHDCLFLLDVAQTAGVLDIDVEAMNVDLLAAPGHKSLLGPTGTGVLYVGPRADVHPWREGGTGGDSIRELQPSELPTALEAGTHNTIGLAGLGAALDELIPSQALVHERSLIRELVELLKDDSRIEFVGDPSPDRRVGVISIRVADMAPMDVAAILDESFGIAVRTGLHCAPHVHRALGTFPDGTVRVSVGASNTTDDIHALVDALKQIAT